MFVCVRDFLCFVFFKQKTAYELRISDWSSDVCSSDLAHGVVGEVPQACEVVTDYGVATVALGYMTFEEVRHALEGADGLEEIANANFTARLNSPFVHPRIRQRVAALMA